MVATVVGFVGVVGFFDSTAIENLDCVAFDLAHDPGMIQPIRPMLVGRHLPKALGAVPGAAQST
jgi:hypothetical protein